MITQELISYVKSELTKGKTREEIHKALSFGGGWTEEDLSEAFREVMPVGPIEKQSQVFIETSTFTQNKTPLQPKPVQPQVQTPFQPPVQTPAQPVMSSPISAMNINPVSNPSPKPISNPGPIVAPKINPNPASVVMQKSPMPIYATASASSMHQGSFLKSLLKTIIVLLVVLGIGYAGWHYRSKITVMFKSYFVKTTPPVTPAIAPAPVVPPPVVVSIPVVKDCGLGVAPNRKVPGSYANDTVLGCLGATAVSCVGGGARATLSDPLFPNTFEVINNQGVCSFKLSYSADINLTDASGQKLSGQSITCPVSVVKMMDESKPKAITFKAPDTTNPSVYGAQMYFYGTLGVFLENNLDQNKIKALGCSGDYINSVITGYANAQNKTKISTP